MPVVMLLIWPLLAGAQAKMTVSGLVSDEQGEPVIGATIMIQGTQSVVSITGVDGDYAVQVPSDAVLEFLVASPEVLLVTTPEPTSITDSYSLLKALNRHPKFDRESTAVKVVANKVGNFEEGRQMYTKLSAVVNRYLKIPLCLIGVIPEDHELQKAVMQQMPISIQNPNAKSAQGFTDLATALETNANAPVYHKRGMSGFFASMVRGNRQ